MKLHTVCWGFVLGSDFISPCFVMWYPFKLSFQIISLRKCVLVSCVLSSRSVILAVPSCLNPHGLEPLYLE